MKLNGNTWNIFNNRWKKIQQMSKQVNSFCKT